MLSKPLKFRNIIKRSNSTKFKYANNGNAHQALFEVCGNVKDNESLYRDQINSYIEESKSYRNCIDILSRLYKENRFQLLESTTGKIIRDVIPNIAPDCIKPCIVYIESCDIGDANKDRLLEAAKAYKSIDRIIDNHKKLSKRFELEPFTNNRLSIKEKCNLICELVDTYNSISPFVKFNIALEELSLLSTISGCHLDESDMVEGVTNYFLLREGNTAEDIASYKRAILESKVLSSDADSNVKYLTNEQSTDILESMIDSLSWEQQLQSWKLSENKSIDDLKSLLKENCNHIDAIRSIVETIDEYCIVNSLDHISIHDLLESNIDRYSGREASTILNYLNETKNTDSSDNLALLYDIYESERSDISYANADDVVEDLQYTFTDSGFDKYRLNNLIQDSITTSKMIDRQSAVKEYKLDVYDFENESNSINESNYCNFVDEDGHIVLKIAGFVNTNTDDPLKNKFSSINFLESTVKCINNALSDRESRAYCSFGENGYGIYLKTTYTTEMTTDQIHDRMFAPDELRSISVLEDCVKEAELYQEKAINLYRRMMKRSIYSSIGLEESKMLLEAFDNLFGYQFSNDFIEECKNEENDISSNNREFFTYTESVDLIEENFDLANDILRYVSPKRAIQEGVNLNTLKLAWQSFKKKVKNFSAKEKEMCRDLDATFNHLLKGVNSFFEVDHREQIITGQIKPSLSKMLKICLGLAGLGIATNFYVSAVVAVVGLAINKRTSIKEKNMILDEIDIELKVVERELQQAESSGSTKKYRYLLTVQKNLQRERQRIYYNLSTKGKVPLPSSAGQDKGRD